MLTTAYAMEEETEKTVPLKYGLISGRHNMPVDDRYIFPNGVPDQDCLAFRKMELTVEAFLIDSGLVRRTGGKLQASGRELWCYITGLTSAAATVAACCNEHNVPLSFLHYDKSTGEYRRQIIVRKK